jgi:hypothetical protein
MGALPAKAGDIDDGSSRLSVVPPDGGHAEAPDAPIIDLVQIRQSPPERRSFIFAW